MREQEEMVSFIENSRPFLQKLGRKLGDTADDVDDWVQDSLIRALKGGLLEVPRDKWKSYMATLYRNVRIDNIRRQRPAINYHEGDFLVEGMYSVGEIQISEETPLADTNAIEAWESIKSIVKSVSTRPDGDILLIAMTYLGYEASECMEPLLRIEGKSSDEALDPLTYAKNRIHKLRRRVASRFPEKTFRESVMFKRPPTWENRTKKVRPGITSIREK